MLENECSIVHFFNFNNLQTVWYIRFLNQITLFVTVIGYANQKNVFYVFFKFHSSKALFAFDFSRTPISLSLSLFYVKLLEPDNAKASRP